MTDGFHLWISGGLFVLGALIMDAPGQEKGGAALSKAVYVAGFARTLLMFAFALSLGYVWYEASYVSAVVYASSGLPGVVIYDGLDFVARRWRASGAAIVAACLIVGPAIASLGAYRLAGDLTRLAHPHASWRLW